MTRSEIESTYQISRRIEGEERALDTAMVTFTSTQQEIDQQWGLYDGYEADPTPNTASSLHAPLQRWGLARILRTRMQAGRAMPLMRVIPPGLDFSSLKAELPEDPVLKVLRERKAAAMGSVPGSFLNLAGLVSPTSQPTTPAAGRSDGVDLWGWVGGGVGWMVGLLWGCALIRGCKRQHITAPACLSKCFHTPLSHDTPAMLPHRQCCSTQPAVTMPLKPPTKTPRIRRCVRRSPPSGKKRFVSFATRTSRLFWL